MWLWNAYFDMLGHVVPRTPLVRSRMLYQALQDFPMRRFIKPSLRLYQADELLGWCHRPNVDAAHSAFEFRARYATGPTGERSPMWSDDAVRVMAYGCSWTFGHGVADDATYAARLATRGLPTENRGVSGYGPAHVYLRLLQRNELDRAAARGAAVLYCWIPDQLLRAWRRDWWINVNAWVSPTASHPVFDLEDGELVFQGLVGPDGGVSADNDLRLVERMEWRLTVKLVESMYREAAARGVKFAVVVPPVRDDVFEKAAAANLVRLLAEASVPCIDLESEWSAGSRHRDGLFYRFDKHPTARWHDAVATMLAPRVEALAAPQVSESAPVPIPGR